MLKAGQKKELLELHTWSAQSLSAHRTPQNWKISKR
jgi:hypothetical protein